MICAIMQPTYIPWMGYFDMIDKVDLFIFYDDVQMTKRSWQVRNRVKGVNDEVWLTIPITKTKSREETLIKSAKLNYNERWIDKHLKTLEHCYRKTPFFSEVFDFLMSLYLEKESLSRFNIDIINAICKAVGITTEVMESSALLGIDGQKDHRLVQICKRVKADQYLSPQGSAVYINSVNIGGEFIPNEIELYYHDYTHPEYTQLNNEFVPYMGIYDLLFNIGFENALSFIRKGRKENIYYKDL